MCNSSNCSHNLDDNLDDLLGEGPAKDAAPWTSESRPVEVKGDLSDAPIRYTHETAAAAAGHRYTEKCDAGGCRNGTFYGYTGRALGNCYTCKGTGYRTFKTSPEARAKARLAAERKAEQKAASLKENTELWKRENADDWNWIVEKSTGDRPFEFAEAMRDALRTYGALTDKQHAAVVRLREKDVERKAQWAAEKIEREANAPVVMLDRIEAAFATALGNGIKRPKLRLDAFKFSLAPATGRNAGAIYVVEAGSDDYLGKIQNGKFHGLRTVSTEVGERIVAAAADPFAAAVAYGQRTGKCCICGRELTNQESVDLGIGPICAGKMGW